MSRTDTLIKLLGVLNHRDNHDHNHEAENEDNREYDEQDIEEVWASDPMPSGSYRNQMTLLKIPRNIQEVESMDQTAWNGGHACQDQ